MNALPKDHFGLFFRHSVCACPALKHVLFLCLFSLDVTRSWLAADSEGTLVDTLSGHTSCVFAVCHMGVIWLGCFFREHPCQYLLTLSSGLLKFPKQHLLVLTWSVDADVRVMAQAERPWHLVRQCSLSSSLLVTCPVLGSALESQPDT